MDQESGDRVHGHWFHEPCHPPLSRGWVGLLEGNVGIQTKGTTSVEYPCLVCISTNVCYGAAQLAEDGDTFLGNFGLGEALDRLLHVGEAEHERFRIGIEGLEVKHALQLFFSKLGVENLRALPDIGDNGGILFLGGLGLVGSFETLE